MSGLDLSLAQSLAQGFSQDFGLGFIWTVEFPWVLCGLLVPLVLLVRARTEPRPETKLTASLSLWDSIESAPTTSAVTRRRPLALLSIAAALACAVLAWAGPVKASLASGGDPDRGGSNPGNLPRLEVWVDASASMELPHSNSAQPTRMQRARELLDQHLELAEFEVSWHAAQHKPQMHSSGVLWLTDDARPLQQTVDENNAWMACGGEFVPGPVSDFRRDGVWWGLDWGSDGSLTEIELSSAPNVLQLDRGLPLEFRQLVRAWCEQRGFELQELDSSAAGQLSSLDERVSLTIQVASDGGTGDVDLAQKGVLGTLSLRAEDCELKGDPVDYALIWSRRIEATCRTPRWQLCVPVEERKAALAGSALATLELGASADSPAPKFARQAQQTALLRAILCAMAVLLAMVAGWVDRGKGRAAD